MYLTSDTLNVYWDCLESMKTLFPLSFLAVALMLSFVHAAPVVQSSDISEDSLKGIATERQKASLEKHAQAVKKAEKAREDAEKEAKEITERNDNGLKKTIQKRSLNNMLPACDRETETPREPGNYEIRY